MRSRALPSALSVGLIRSVTSIPVLKRELFGEEVYTLSRMRRPALCLPNKLSSDNITPNERRGDEAFLQHPLLNLKCNAAS